MNYFYGAGFAVLAYLVTAAWSTASNLQARVTEVAQLKHELYLRDGRLASYKRMIDRRDAAINASKCKAQLKEWVSHPENIPKPFDPFNQLLPENPR